MFLFQELLTSRNKTTNDIELTTKQYEQKLQQKEQQIRVSAHSCIIALYHMYHLSCVHQHVISDAYPPYPLTQWFLQAYDAYLKKNNILWMKTIH